MREEARRQERMLDVEHREWMICLGRGFDFLHTPNQALIIGPYSPDLADPLRKAAAIIEGNMKAGRIPDDGFLLLASVPYDEIGVDRARAELKSRFLSCFGECCAILSVLSVVTRMVTSEIEDYGYYDDEAPHIRPKASLADLGLDDSAAFHFPIEAVRGVAVR